MFRGSSPGKAWRFSFKLPNNGAENSNRTVGMTYERAAIAAWLADKERSPATGEVLPGLGCPVALCRCSPAPYQIRWESRCLDF
jgi:hypothetical protein